MDHVTTNPDLVSTPSEVKSTCKYPVDDVYSLLELTEPEIRATCSTVLHDDEVHRLMVTLSQHDSVLKEEKERRMVEAEAISHLQLSPLP